MARIGLGERWHCAFANDCCPKKAKTYRANFPSAEEFCLKRIEDVEFDRIPAGAHLAWASFPCQDLSLAGKGKGLDGQKSNAFWPFWQIVKGFSAIGKPIPIVVLENVVGALTSNGGRDFQLLLQSLQEAGYSYGPMVVDARHFLPQSRPRLFIVAVRKSVPIDPDLCTRVPVQTAWYPKSIQNSYDRLDDSIRKDWIWWNLPFPLLKPRSLKSIIETRQPDSAWHSPGETSILLERMSPANREKLEQVKLLGKPVVGTIYKRTRIENGVKQQRTEVRFDQTSGCLRTPGGGSSRQIIICVNGGQIRTRLLSAREAARLMGLPDTYNLPLRYNDAYHVAGDGVAVPVVRWISENLLEPIAERISLTVAA